MSRNEEARNEGAEAPAPESRFEVYLGAFIGAFCVALGDTIRNDHAAATSKISEVLASFIRTPEPYGQLAALVIILGLGLAACWLHRPRTRLDGFARGISVFALLTVTAPFEPAPPISEGIRLPEPAVATAALSQTGSGSARRFRRLPGEDVVFARQDSGGSGSGGEEPARVKAKVRIESAERARTLESAMVTLRDKESGRVLGREKVLGGILSIERPAGSYVLEFESPGFRITQADLMLDASSKAYAVHLTPSIVPLGLQRFVGAKDGRLVDAKRDAVEHSERGEDPPPERP